MTDDASRNIISRRNRPAKSPLSRDVIVSTALHILEREGLPGLTLRRIATALDTGPASLYVYVANLDELHALMLDRALEPVHLSGSRRLPWRNRLKALLRSYLNVLYERQGLAQIALSTIAAGPSSLRIWEMLLSLLQEGGVDDLKAAWGVDLLILYVTAIAAEQSQRREGDQGLGRVKKALSTASKDQFPRVFALKHPLLAGNGASRNNWALDVIIDGITGGGSQPVTTAAPRVPRRRSFEHKR
jgi:AcrR family transcriptional regulator